MEMMTPILISVAPQGPTTLANKVAMAGFPRAASSLLGITPMLRMEINT